MIRNAKPAPEDEFDEANQPIKPEQAEGEQPSPEDDAIPGADTIVELRTRITEAAKQSATNEGLEQQLLDMLVGSVVEIYPPEAVATEFLSALWAKEHQPGQLDSLCYGICDLLRELHPDSEANLEKLGLKFVTLSDALEACHAALNELGNELEKWVDSIREEERAEAAGDAVTLILMRVEELGTLNLPRKAYALILPVLLRGSKHDRLLRLREILTCVAGALPEGDDNRAKIDAVADAVEAATLEL
jgi:hypothetical protein